MRGRGRGSGEKPAGSFSHTRPSPAAAAGPVNGSVGLSNLPKEKSPTGNWQCFLSIPSACLGDQGLVQAPGMGKGRKQNWEGCGGGRGTFDKSSWRRNWPGKRDWRKRSWHAQRSSSGGTQEPAVSTAGPLYPLIQPTIHQKYLKKEFQKVDP